MMLFFTAHTINLEVNNLVKTCYKYKSLLQSNEGQELGFFAQEVEHCFPQFSGGESFNFNHKNFLALFISMTTYFLAIVPFDKEFVRQ